MSAREVSLSRYSTNTRCSEPRRVRGQFYDKLRFEFAGLADFLGRCFFLPCGPSSLLGLLSFLDGHDFTGLVGLPSTAPDTVYRSSRFEGSSALWIIFLFCMIAITPSRRSRQYSSKPPDAHVITVSDWSTQSWEAAFGATSQDTMGISGTAYYQSG